MCGLIGIMNPGAFSKKVGKNSYSFPEESMLEELFLLSSLRGVHSSGLFWVKDKKATVYKKVMPASDFIKTNMFDEIKNKGVNWNNYIIGHTRHATSGGMSIDAAHPHQEGNITLVHNGTLTGWFQLCKATPRTDSQAIALALDESNGDYISVLEKLSGAYTIIFFSELDGYFYIARNKERPLTYCKYGETTLLSSESDFSLFTVRRQTTVENKELELGEFDENTLYRYSYDQNCFQKVEKYKENTKKSWPNFYSNINDDDIAFDSFTSNHYLPRQRPASNTPNSDKDKIKATLKEFLDKEKITKEKIYFVPTEFYKFSGSSKNSRGAIFGLAQTEEGKIIPDICVASYNVEDPAEFVNCSYCIGEVGNEFLNIAGSEVYSKFPQAIVKLIIAPDSVKGYTITQEEV